MLALCKVDAKLPAGKRVTEVCLGPDLDPVLPNSNYICGITTTLGKARGYGTDFVADAPRVVDEEYEVPLTDMIVEYFQRLNMRPIDTTEPSKHGRVIEIHKGEDDSPSLAMAMKVQTKR